MNNKTNKILWITYSAIIAALYVALTWVSNIFGLASMAVQVRLSEALCVLSFFTPSATIGMFIGCLISNLTMGSLPLDIIFGSLATLIGTYFGTKMKNKYLVPLPTVVSNTLIIPPIILFCYTEKTARTLGLYALTALGVLIGEMVSAYLIGILLLLAMEKRKIFKK